MGDSATPHVNRWYDLINNHPGVRSAVARIPKDEVVKETQTRNDVSLIKWGTHGVAQMAAAGGALYAKFCTVTLVHSDAEQLCNEVLVPHLLTPGCSPQQEGGGGQVCGAPRSQ